MHNATMLPPSPEAQREKAEAYLDYFSRYTTYRHRQQNEYLRWLNAKPQITVSQTIDFFNFWYPVSRHQPQILLRIAAAFPDWSDRKLLMANYLEEDGQIGDGHDPHYVLLKHLINNLGGTLRPDPVAQALVTDFQHSQSIATPGHAVGSLAAIEHPALDISDYFRLLTKNAGRTELLTRDPYLAIHVHAEPHHIIWSHGRALEWLGDTHRQARHGFTGGDIINTFERTMRFWTIFWAHAFKRLGYRADTPA